MKPKRSFSANIGQHSRGNAGPDQIEYDFDQAFKMFDPSEDGGGISTENLNDLIITTVKVVDTAITNAKLASNSVTTNKIQNLTITTEKLADLLVTTIKMADLAVTSGKLANLSVLTSKINDLAVTTEKIANLSVSTGKVQNGAITRDKIANAAINLSKMDLSSIDTRYYTETEVDTIINNLAGAGRSTETIKGIFDALNTHKNSSDHDGRYYTKPEIDAHKKNSVLDHPDGSVTNTKLANNSVTSNKIAGGAITPDKIQNGAVNTDKLSSSVISQLGGSTGAALSQNKHVWIATEGQQTFNLPDGASYLPGYGRLRVEVGGIVQPNTTETSTTFTVAEPLGAGTHVYAEWWEGVFHTQQHKNSHYAGGSDEIDVTRLKNYQESIQQPIVDITDQVNQLSDDVASIDLSPFASKQQEVWTFPTLENNWTTYNETFFAPSYYKDEFGIIRLRGMASAGSARTTIFTLPVGYRPSKAEVFVVVTNTGHGSVTIYPTGAIEFSTGGNGYVSLSGITFRID